MSNSLKTELTRRQALKVAGAASAAFAFPTIVPSTVFGKNAPSNRVVIGMVGVGRQGRNANLGTLKHMDDVQIVAVCEVDKWRLQNAFTLTCRLTPSMPFLIVAWITRSGLLLARKISGTLHIEQSLSRQSADSGFPSTKRHSCSERPR